VRGRKRGRGGKGKEEERGKEGKGKKTEERAKEVKVHSEGNC
jgi:hypothetical protein